VDTQGNEGNASMLEQVKRPNLWRWWWWQTKMVCNIQFP